jgi:hypothetical protein
LCIVVVVYLYVVEGCTGSAISQEYIIAHAIGMIGILSRIVGHKACRVRSTVHAHGAPSLNGPIIDNHRLPNNHAPIVFHVNGTSLTLGKMGPQQAAAELHVVSLDIQGTALTLHAMALHIIICLYEEREREREVH